MIPTGLKRQLLEGAFDRMISWRQHDIPGWPDVHEFRTKTWDGVSVYGWVYRPESHVNGSLLLLPGFTQNSGAEDLWKRAKKLADQYGVIVGSCDFRHHGMSDNALPTFGLGESWDIGAVLDEAERNNLPRPYVLLGESLGAMAAQVRAIEDSRVDAAFLMAPPAWPWHAIDHCIGHSLNCGLRLSGILDNFAGPVRDTLKGMGLSICSVINEVYADETPKVLDGGCLFNHDCSPEHEPLALYVMGTDDEYGLRHTRDVWGHWYKDRPAQYNATPSEAPNQSKWMIEVEGAGHPGVCEYDPYRWDGLEPLVDDFLQTILERKGARQQETQRHSEQVMAGGIPN